MKYFFDTEFLDTGSKVELISIAIVNESRASYYAVSSEFDEEAALQHPWLSQNVLPKIEPVCLRRPRERIAQDILEFLGGPDCPELHEFWSWKGAHDWLLLTQLYGPLMDRPKCFPNHYLDIHQLYLSLNKPAYPHRSRDCQHHALYDAFWHRDVYFFLTNVKSTIRWREYEQGEEG